MLHEMRQKDEEGFSNRDIVDEFITFFIAGMDTTAHLAAMATYFFLKNPQTHDKLRAEADKYLGDPSNISIDDINKMDYATAFIKEALRLAAPGASSFERMATEDHKIGPYDIKAGTILCYS